MTHGDIALVVADVNPADFTESQMLPLVRRHHEVVLAAFRHGAVLPLRFATMLTDDEAAWQLLRTCHDEAVANLDAVAGHREWGVRIRRSNPAPAKGISGTDYLAQRRRARGGGDETHRRLARHAGRSVLRPPGSEFGLDAVYLVAVPAEAAFLAEVDRLGEAAQTTGPWPPYSFSELRTTAP
ncbi:GvpL/GvpF family gas vesicle protein [Kutzneria sp. NPDC052558]|uniref:GvpL/GvpF family gas vesicle protein n=1 Tax=Kutzneria sp. NPDC052558 TaxID=3364121 RepID=UPI0037C98847